MTKSLRAPRLLKTAPAPVEQIPTHTRTHRESEDNYQWVAATLVEDLRVILCKNGMNYIPQPRYANGLRGAPWRSLCCALTKSLMRLCDGLQGRCGPVSTGPLAALPEKARDWGKK